MLRKNLEGCIIGSMRFHGPNVVSYKIVAGNQLLPLIGAYLPPSTLEHMSDLEEVLNRFLGRYHIVLGDLNAYIG